MDVFIFKLIDHTHKLRYLNYCSKETTMEDVLREVGKWTWYTKKHALELLKTLPGNNNILNKVPDFLTRQSVSGELFGKLFRETFIFICDYRNKFSSR